LTDSLIVWLILCGCAWVGFLLSPFSLQLSRQPDAGTLPRGQTLDLPGFLAQTAGPCRYMRNCWIANSADGLLFAFQQTVQ
jgi:hypothetical protein